jgi:hypothetical protein
MTDQVNGYGETPAEYWKRRFHEECERLDESGQQVITLWADKRKLRTERDAAVEALRMLVQLKDGPRDDLYRALKDDAWGAARAALGLSAGPEGPETP